MVAGSAAKPTKKTKKNAVHKFWGGTQRINPNLTNAQRPLRRLARHDQLHNSVALLGATIVRKISVMIRVITGGGTLRAEIDHGGGSGGGGSGDGDDGGVQWTWVGGRKQTSPRYFKYVFLGHTAHSPTHRAQSSELRAQCSKRSFKLGGKALLLNSNKPSRTRLIRSQVVRGYQVARNIPLAQGRCTPRAVAVGSRACRGHRTLTLTHLLHRA